MRVEDFNYDLPEELIAQTPLKDRASSKLLVLDKNTGAIEHLKFSNIIDFLDENDVLVLNDTKVLPSRIYGVKEDTKAHIEMLLLKDLGDDVYEVLARPGRRLKIGTRVNFNDLFRVIWKELRISFICGLTLAFCNFLKLIYIDSIAMDVSLVISITLVLTIFLAKVIGSILPIFAEKFKMDPAVMASPLITTIVDAGSLIIYFKIACILLNI